MTSNPFSRGAMATTIVVLSYAVAPSSGAQSQSKVTLADYERAAVFQNARALVSQTRLQPSWIANSDRFWYLEEAGQGDAKVKTFIMVDPERNRQGPAFDHARLAAGLSAAADKAYRAAALPFGSFVYADGERAIRFRVEKADWRCDLRAYTCVADATAAGALDGEVLSPDGRWAVSAREYNLQVRDTHTGEERMLTRDGQEFSPYGALPTSSSVTQRLLQRPPLSGSQVRFSPDSRYLLVARADVSRVREMGIVQTIPGERPITHTYRFPVAGEAEIPRYDFFLSELQTGQLRKVDFPAIGLPGHLVTYWSEEGTRAAFTEHERGYKGVKLHVVDATGGRVHTPVIERSETYVDIAYQMRMFGNDLIWSSGRDGWNHLYRLDARSGEVLGQLTQGAWAVRELVHVDANAKWIYFTAGGREEGRDPYYRHLYRVGLDGSGLNLLTPEPADHAIVFSPTGRYFIDTYSRLDQPPVSVLRRSDGEVMRELQRVDIGPLQAAGWKPARPFTVKARDGHTDLYGAMFLPSSFDPNRRYPVLDWIYGGPQMIRTPKSFDVDAFEDQMALAELGFIVVVIDGLGTPFRSRTFRDMSYRNLGDAGGLEDHVAGLRQLAQIHPYFDLDRVGIYGHSFGGYASARAMLKFPDFYKVAVSSAGNHDQRSYWSAFNERYYGWPLSEVDLLNQSNAPLAGKLKGKLLLVHGDMDDNVHPTHTMQLADALIEANKNFDLLLLPNRDHMFVNVAYGKAASSRMAPYFLRRRWDYFVEHLLGTEPPRDFDLAQRIR